MAEITFTEVVRKAVKLFIFLWLIIILVVIIAIITNGILDYIHPTPAPSCACNCSQTKASEPKQGYVHDNIIGAHSDFDPRQFFSAADEYGYFQGYSMEPTLYEGNILLLKNMTSQYHLDPGEIVRYTTISYPGCKSDVPLNVDSPYVIHRIKSIYGADKIYTQGDNLHDVEIIHRCQITHIVVGVLYR